MSEEWGDAFPYYMQSNRRVYLVPQPGLFRDYFLGVNEMKNDNNIVNDEAKQDVNELTKLPIRYNLTDAKISKLRESFMPLKIDGIADKEGYLAVHEARMEVKRIRVAVEKKRVDLKADALEYGRRVDAEAKRITALLEPIEKHLESEEARIDQERERIKREAEMERLRIQREAEEKERARVQKLVSDRTGELTRECKMSITLELIEKLKVMTEDEYFDFYADSRAAYHARVAREEEEKKKAQEAEQLRLAQIAEDARKLMLQRIAQEEEARKLAEQRAAQEAEAKALRRKLEEDARAARAEMEAKIREEQMRVRAELEAQATKLAEQRKAQEAEAARLRAAQEAEAKAKQEAERLAIARWEAFKQLHDEERIMASLPNSEYPLSWEELLELLDEEAQAS